MSIEITILILTITITLDPTQTAKRFPETSIQEEKSNSSPSKIIKNLNSKKETKVNIKVQQIYSVNKKIVIHTSKQIPNKSNTKKKTYSI